MNVSLRNNRNEIYKFIYIYIYRIVHRRTFISFKGKKKKSFNHVHQIVREEEIRSAAQIHRAGRSSFELERLRGRSSESYAGSCELDKHVPQFVVPGIRLDSSRGDFSTIRESVTKGKRRDSRENSLTSIEYAVSMKRAT